MFAVSLYVCITARSLAISLSPCSLALYIPLSLALLALLLLSFYIYCRSFSVYIYTLARSVYISIYTPARSLYIFDWFLFIWAGYWGNCWEIMGENMGGSLAKLIDMNSLSWCSLVSSGRQIQATSQSHKFTWKIKTRDKHQWIVANALLSKLTTPGFKNVVYKQFKYIYIVNCVFTVYTFIRHTSN